MAVRNILLLGNPGLREPSRRVRSFGEESVRSCIEDLRDTLADVRRRHGFGRAIAAPQIGVALRILYLHVDVPLVLINPKIMKRSRRKMMLWDDCFSFPEILVKVRRNLLIDVLYQDERGRARSLKAEGTLSELLQHEIDHLDGVLAIDRAIDSRHIVLREEHERWKAKRGMAL
jgi:peptide deformylase